MSMQDPTQLVRAVQLGELEKFLLPGSEITPRGQAGFAIHALVEGFQNFSFDRMIQLVEAYAEAGVISKLRIIEESYGHN